MLSYVEDNGIQNMNYVAGQSFMSMNNVDNGMEVVEDKWR